jgi:ribulose 1,5-bisphosphate carboxylase large subunit-like protein
MYTRALTMPFLGIKPAMPVVGGGSHPRMIPGLVKDLGIDFVAGVGGAIQAHPQGTPAGVRAMRQALDAAIQDVSLDIYASEHPELLAALEKW